MGKVSNNLFQHTNPVKKIAKGVKRWVKDVTCILHTIWTHSTTFIHISVDRNLITSTLHTVRTVHMCKVGLPAYDTKRLLCDDTIHTHAHGHRSTLLYSHSSYSNVLRQPSSVECGVVNLNTSSQFGSHWVFYYRNKGNRIYFDSFGQITPVEIQRYLKTGIEFARDREVMQRNTDIVQAVNTPVCGHLYLFVLKPLACEKFQTILNHMQHYVGGYT